MTINEYKVDRVARDADIRTLMGDHRFSALLALVSDLRDEQIIYTSNPALADQPGVAAHNLGSISALLSLENQLEHIFSGGESRDDAT
tara:strand:+ start:191 stop:454 length:264 start_codon:yes stop_codon:yes gene_type:complete